MARGPKKHLKRLHAPKHWMLDKLGGVFATRPSTGPHKLRESLPLVVLIRNRLKYALNYNEAKMITNSREIKVDGTVRTDHKYPTGFMDVISINKTNENFRMVYDVKGRFLPMAITAQEANWKLCKVKAVKVGVGKIPYLVTHDGRTIRYPNPSIKSNDTIKYNLEDKKIEDVIHFAPGVTVMVIAGHNTGRVGVISSRERHQGSYDIVHIKDSNSQQFATRVSNVFVIGASNKKKLIKLPSGGGIKKTIDEDRAARLHIQ